MFSVAYGMLFYVFWIEFQKGDEIRIFGDLDRVVFWINMLATFVIPGLDIWHDYDVIDKLATFVAMTVLSRSCSGMLDFMSGEYVARGLAGRVLMHGIRGVVPWCVFMFWMKSFSIVSNVFDGNMHGCEQATARLIVEWRQVLLYGIFKLFVCIVNAGPDAGGPVAYEADDGEPSEADDGEPSDTECSEYDTEPEY